MSGDFYGDFPKGILLFSGGQNRGSNKDSADCLGTYHPNDIAHQRYQEKAGIVDAITGLLAASVEHT